MARLGDERAAASSEHLSALPEDDLDSPRIVVGRKLKGSFGRLDVLEIDDTPSTLETAFCATTTTSSGSSPPARCEAATSECAEVVAFLELRDPAERDDSNSRGSRKPVISMPACAL